MYGTQGEESTFVIPHLYHTFNFPDNPFTGEETKTQKFSAFVLDCTTSDGTRAK